MLKLHITNETDLLEAVILGIPDSPGKVPALENAYDPKSKEFIRMGQYTDPKKAVLEMKAFEEVLKKYGVKVYRPHVLEDVNQIFTRDISFVIEDKIVIPNMLEDRAEEIEAISYIFDQIDSQKVLKMPEKTRAEGGDVMLWNDYIFVGYSEKEDFENYTVSRTNSAGLEFIKKNFPHKTVLGFQLNKSDTEPRDNALHLDCCFQPIGEDQAIIYKGGFKNEKDYDFLLELFGRNNIMDIDREEMFNMASNVFSISPEVIVSERSLKRLNSELRKKGFTVEEIPYYEISKQEGLLRCSTMPLRRKSI